MPTEYLAGLFDGEGTINISPRYSRDQKRGNLYLQIAVGNTKPLCCRLFQFAFGGNVYLNHRATRRHQAYWLWVVNYQKAAVALRCMRPHLRLKRAEARIALTFAEHMAAHQGKRMTARDRAYRSRLRHRLIRLHGYASRVKNWSI